MAGYGWLADVMAGYHELCMDLQALRRESSDAAYTAIFFFSRTAVNMRILSTPNCWTSSALNIQYQQSSKQQSMSINILYHEQNYYLLNPSPPLLCCFALFV